MKALVLVGCLVMTGCTIEGYPPGTHPVGRDWTPMPTNRTSQPLRLPAPNQPPAILPEANSVTATFTGKTRNVQTVTGRFVTECEYMYGQQRFTRLFDTACPYSIEVR